MSWITVDPEPPQTHAVGTRCGECGGEMPEVASVVDSRCLCGRRARTRMGDASLIHTSGCDGHDGCECEAKVRQYWDEVDRSLAAMTAL